MTPLPLGLGRKSGRSSLQGVGASASLVLDPDGPIATDCLDELLAGVQTSFIKLDIEGAEAEALRGGVEVMRRDRPHLAVSVYHKPWHLWSIINWLAASIDGYEYRMRAYGHQGFDVVLYARSIHH